MMQGIIKAFKDNIEHVDWVDKDTVTAVEEKVCGTRPKSCFISVITDICINGKVDLI